MSLAILTLAIPRLISAAYLLPGNAAIALVDSGARPSDAGVIRAIDAQAAALQVMERADPHLDTAYLAQSLVDSAGSVSIDLADIEEVAHYHLRKALTMAPGQPRGWFMLARMRFRAGDKAGAAKALSLSFAADPHVPLFAPFRWPMAYGLGKELSRETREQASLEFLSFFRTQPKIAVQMALREDRLRDLAALADERGEDRERLAKVIRSLEYERTGT